MNNNCDMCSEGKRVSCGYITESPTGSEMLHIPDRNWNLSRDTKYRMRISKVKEEIDR